ncbi:MAG TPA: PaaI family thioesterase [Syntrophorhabdales bacterium]|nr:PaaI family thioesterase [Syntrophorhabdales bacterium]
MSKLPVYTDSFFASKKRPDGMALTILYEDGVVYTNMCIDSRFEGYKGVVHGGMVFGILDVIMWYTILLNTRKICMTRRTEMEFLKPVLCDTMYRAEARLKGVEEKDVIVSAWVQDAGGERYAEVNGIFREAKGLDIAEFVNSFDYSDSSPEIRDFFYSLIPVKTVNREQ